MFVVLLLVAVVLGVAYLIFSKPPEKPKKSETEDLGGAQGDKDTQPHPKGKARRRKGKRGGGGGGGGGGQSSHAQSHQQAGHKKKQTGSHHHHIEDSEHCVFRVRGHASEVNDVQLSPDGKFLLSCADDRSARLYRLRPGATKKDREHDPKNPKFSYLVVSTGYDYPTACCWSPSGREFALARSPERTVHLYRVSEARAGETKGDSEESEGHPVFSARNFPVSVQEYSSFETNHSSDIFWLQWTADGHLITGTTGVGVRDPADHGGKHSADSAFLWRVRDGANAGEIRPNQIRSYGFALGGKTTHFIAAGTQMGPRLYSSLPAHKTTHHKVKTHKGAGGRSGGGGHNHDHDWTSLGALGNFGAASAVGFGPGRQDRLGPGRSEWLVFGGTKGQVGLLDLGVQFHIGERPKMLLRAHAGQTRVDRIAVSPELTCTHEGATRKMVMVAVTQGTDLSVYRWLLPNSSSGDDSKQSQTQNSDDPQGWSLLWSAKTAHLKQVYALEFSADGEVLVTCGGDHWIRFWGSRKAAKK